jgi:Fe-S-cluster-containing dehydrogenase component
VTAPNEESSRTLIDDLLAEQQRLTAVERFSQRHDRGALPAQERYYRDLIPQTKPQPGQQLAFAVDLDACTGCKACVSACHSLNGLEEEETWRSVGLIHGGTSAAPYQQTVTTACHHCVEPACLEGCPVMAYEKDSDTGIVRHLDDQCIGCQYCVLKCPYDVPKYSKRLGIVRKCDMCIDRLAVGEAPACVQACPTSAIRIEIVDKTVVTSAAKSGVQMVPGAFDSSYTKPTSSYRTHRGLPSDARPADSHEQRREPAHWPLIVMLVLTQLATGAFVAAVFAPQLRFLGWGALHAGLIASVLHLGRPFGAWRFFLGLRTSWMSREILAFGIFSAVATLALLVPAFTIVAALCGLGGVFTSAMIYIDTRRPAWRAAITLPRFFSATLLLGVASVCGFAPILLALALVGYERFTFFTRATALRMPGGVPA